MTINLTEKYSQDALIELFHHIKFHPDQMKVCKKMKRAGFAFSDVVTLRQRSKSMTAV